MSARAARKLKNEDDLSALQNQLKIENSEDEENIINDKDSVPNRFAFFNEGDEEEEEEAEIENQEVVQNIERNKKKKKPKKKRKSLADDANNKKNNKEEDPFEDLENNYTTYGEISQDNENKSARKQKSFLTTVEHRNLDPDNEMRRLFGSGVIQSERGHRHRGRNERRQKQTWLVQMRQEWIPASRFGLSMERDPDHFDYFIFRHNRNYQKNQIEFWHTSDLGDPELFGNILRNNPYHIDTLLQLSEVMRLSDDSQAAADLVAKSLYALECAFHPSFSLTTGQSKLDYRHLENRSFFITLFLHSRFVSDRGCHRTALELCKLLFNINNHDPLGALLVLDYYALRAREYNFICQYWCHMKDNLFLKGIPSFFYSTALAFFLSENIEKAKITLEEAIIQYPGLFKKLIEQLDIQTDSKMSKSSLFSSPTDGDALDRLYSLYVDRAAGCWKRDDILEWLRECTHNAIDNYDSMSKTDRNKLEDDRKRLFKKMPKQFCRHLILSGANPPPQSIKQSLDTSIVDPFPPEETWKSYDRPEARQRRFGGNVFSLLLQSLNPNFDVNRANEGNEEDGAEGGEGLIGSTGRIVQSLRELVAGIQFMPPPAGDGEAAEREEDDFD